MKKTTDSDLKLPPFIVLEGCEGSGKTTQMKNLEKRFPDAVFFREPGGTDFAKSMRGLVLHDDKGALERSAIQQMNLVFAGREDNIRSTVVPSRLSGKAVFADRYDASTFAYQIFGMEGKNLFSLFESNRLVMGPLEHLPTLYVILDVSPEVGMARVAGREAAKGETNHFDKRGPEFHARVREGYKRFAEINQGRCVVIDASKSKEDVWRDIEEAIRPYFKKSKE